MLILFEHSEKRLADRLRFEATIHGAKIDSKAVEYKPAQTKQGFVFGDPDDNDNGILAYRHDLDGRVDFTVGGNLVMKVASVGHLLEMEESGCGFYDTSGHDWNTGSCL